VNKKAGAIIIEGHVQGLSNTRSLGEVGIPVYVVDKTNCIARYSRYCQKFFRCPDYNSDEFADFLLNLAEKEQLHGWVLLPSNDHAVLTISRHKLRLERHFKVITPGLDIIENIYDKSRLLRTAEKVGDPIPKTFYPVGGGNPLEGFSLAFPVLTRGRFGLDFYRATGRKAFLAEDIEELNEQLTGISKRTPLNKTLTQELIPDDGTNKTISYCAFCVHGEIKTYWMGEKVRQHPLRFGTATFARSVRVMACHRQSVPLLNALKYTGVCEVEYLRDPRDGLYKLIEINARTWLWVGLAKACGVDFAKLAYDHVNGRTTGMPVPGRYDTGVCWVNPVTDMVYAAKAVISGRLGFPDYIRSMRGRKMTNALVEKGDWKPGIMYLANLLLYVKHR
jgi:D-aspartate ligase